jgi:glyoxylase-like metal-dependent hydrolase (beta-lactamase superfamily II)
MTPTIARFELGPFATNCYVVSVPGAADCWIVDASFEPGEMIDHVRAQGLRPAAVILTHAHVDHIAGLDDVARAFPKTPVMIHEAERDWLTDPMLNLSGAYGLPISFRQPDRLLRDADTLALGPTTWRVLHTPGHSPGGIALVLKGEPHVALTGDALFAGSIGRTDFPGCSFEALAASIREKLYTLPADTVIHPGHGPATTIGREMKSNQFVRV